MKRYTPKLVAMLLIAAMPALTVAGCDKKNDTAPAIHADGTLEVNDTELTTNVQQALIVNDQLKGFQITAKVQKGDVLLIGIVKNQEQRDLAASISSNIGGVHTIHNEITIAN